MLHKVREDRAKVIDTIFRQEETLLRKVAGQKQSGNEIRRASEVARKILLKDELFYQSLSQRFHHQFFLLSMKPGNWSLSHLTEAIEHKRKLFDDGFISRRQMQSSEIAYRELVSQLRILDEIYN